MCAKASKLGAALITGASQRIGKAIALKLADAGYDIALHYNSSQAQAKKTAAAIQKSGVQCKIFSANLFDEKAAAGLITDVTSKFSNLNILVNNASIFKKSTLKSGRITALKENFQLHLFAPFQLIADFAKRCKKGQIINILDTNVSKAKITHFSYLLSKKSLLELTDMAAVELAPNIRVNGIAPGLILPPEGKKEDYLKRLAKAIPMQTIEDVKNITHAIQFLIENTYITGQIIYVDGGEHLTH